MEAKVKGIFTADYYGGKEYLKGEVAMRREKETEQEALAEGKAENETGPER